MPALVLTDRKIVHVGGGDAEHFLQNLITANIGALEADAAQPAALLTPQGKILFDFLISHAPETGYCCDVRAGLAEDFIRRLTLYKLRAAVTLQKRDDLPVIAGWGGNAPHGALRDRRFPKDAGVWRLYGSGAILDADLNAWTALRIAHGAAESGADYALSDVFPHDILMDHNGGIDFRKGCYVGQEVVSRMQHRGTARRRVTTVIADKPLPEAGTAILAGEKPVGVLGSVAGREALAIVRTDRVAGALNADIALTVGGAPVRLVLPEWTGLSFDIGDASAADA